MLKNLPTVQNNLAALQKTLSNPAVWGLPVENCRVLQQPDSVDYVLDSLSDTATVATDALVFYFAGHGLIDPGNEDELYLALPGSDIERAYRTAVPYGWVRREMQVAKARRKIVILDCCYSGRALGEWMGDSEGDAAGHLEIEGACVLTATARTRRALAPPGGQFTAFTGELISILTEGIPEGPDLLDMETLFRHLRIRMKTKGFPLPQRAQLNQGGYIALARNRASTTRSDYAATHRFESASKARDDPPFWEWAGDAVAAEDPIPGDDTPPLEPSAGDTAASRNPIGRGDAALSEFEETPAALSIVALLGWMLIAALLAYVRQPQPWLIAAGSSGFISLLAVRHEALIYKGIVFVLPCLGAYIYACTQINDWYILAWVSLTLLLYVVAMLARLTRLQDTEPAWGL
jgi:peptide/nickel transport system substrate-binding protein